MIKRIEVLNLEQIQSIKHLFKETDLVISIVSPGPPVDFSEGKPHSILHLQFHDIDEDLFVGSTLYRAADATIVTRIIDYVRWSQAADESFMLYIHCEAGISRSPAVALAVAEIVGFKHLAWKLVETYPCFNRFVYRKIMNEFDQQCKSAVEGAPCLT